MNFLERWAIRRAESLLASQLESGEQVLEFDVGSMGARRVDVIVTTAALYVVPDGAARAATRLPLYDLAYVQVRGSSLAVVARDSNQITVNFGRGTRKVGEVLQRQLSALDEYDEAIELPGGVLVLHYEPWRDQSMSSWTVSTDPQSMLGQPGTASAIDAARHDAGHKVLARARAYPEAQLSTQPSERDWTQPANAWLRWVGDASGLASWCLGDQVDGTGSGSPRLLVLSEERVHIVAVPDVTRAMGPLDTPSGLDISIRDIADWECRDPEPSGHRLVRLLVLGPKGLASAAFDDALEAGDSMIALLGFKPTKQCDDYVASLVNAIKERGAFSPGTRGSHPLQAHS